VGGDSSEPAFSEGWHHRPLIGGITQYCVLWTQIFTTSQYAEAYCRISSYLQTMTNQGYKPLVAIQLALSGQLYAVAGE